MEFDGAWNDQQSPLKVIYQSCLNIQTVKPYNVTWQQKTICHVTFSVWYGNWTVLYPVRYMSLFNRDYG